MSEILAGKSALIVAKKLDNLALMRSLFAELGCQDITAASSANMALSMLRMTSYDFCIMESNLGDREKTGTQLLEEAFYEGLKPTTSSFILVLSENEDSPKDAIQYNADMLVTKPLDAQQIRNRVEKLVRLKQAVYPIESKVDKGDVDQALQLMPRLIAKFAALELYLHRLKGQLLLKLGRYEEGLSFFARVIDDHDISWAHMGQGICNFHLGNYEQAQTYFHYTLEQNRASLEAYYWLSRIYRGVGDYKRAQIVLQKGVSAAQTSPVLQAELAHVAAENLHWELAIDAFRKAIKYGRSSCHQSEYNYFGLARCLLMRLAAANKPGQVKSDPGMAVDDQSDALQAMETLIDEYHDDARLRFRARLMTTEIYQITGDKVRADSIAKNAWAIYQTLDSHTQAEELDTLLEGVEGTGQQQAVEDFRNQFNETVYTQSEWGKHNLRGMDLYRKGKFFEAVAAFDQALDIVPRNSSVLFNMVQAGQEAMRLDPKLRAQVLRQTNTRLFSLELGALNSKQQERHRTLMQHRLDLLKPSF